MPLFALVHFPILHYSSRVFPSCLFLSLFDDTHILGLAHVVSLALSHFATQLVFVGLFVQPRKCLDWVPFKLSLGIVPLVELCCPPNGIKILGIPFGLTSFTFFFNKKL
jgi:hypothetical protein